MTDIGRTHATKRLFLTGEPGCGKTTVIRKAGEMLADRGVVVGGMISGEIRSAGIRVGFSIEDVLTHASGVLASVGVEDGPHVGKYRVNLHDLETVGAESVKRGIHNAAVVMIDELGPMELHSGPFIESVTAALDSEKHILGTIHKRANHPLIQKVKSNPQVEIVVVTNQNRDTLPTRITQEIIGTA